MKQIIEKLLIDFELLSFSPQIAFEPFQKADIESYYKDASCFSLRFKKKAGQYILYGLPHVALRRQFFNALDLEQRRTLFKDKCDFQHISAWLEKSIQTDFSAIQITDIGMGESVYKIQDANLKSWVLKKEKKHYFKEFQTISNQLQLGGIAFYLIQKPNSEWLLMEDKGTETLNDYLMKQESPNKKMIKSLAQHAFLGDLLHRGERHLENYLVQEDTVFPIDISYLYYPNNNFWTARYMAAGAYEFSVCVDRESDQLDIQLWELFWDAYVEASESFNLCAIQSAQAKPYIDTFYADREAYLASYKELYLKNIQHYVYRLKFKKKLDMLFERNSDSLSPLLKMYFYANRKRVQAFLHLEEHGLFLLDEIEALTAIS